MTEKDLDAFAALMFGLGETFNETVSKVRVGIYFDALSDLSLDAVRAAARAHLNAGKFFPKPAELREHASGNVEDRAEAAWLHLLKEVRRVGYMGTPTWPDEATKAAAMSLYGGWRRLCENLPAGGPELVGIRKQFSSAFGATARQQIAAGELPPSRDEARQVLADLKKKLDARALPAKGL